jgi:pentose-5-phosphate-3-epimerase
MIILPSLLEYSQESLISRLDSIFENTESFKQITKQTNSNAYSLHLDFVLPQFAKDRSVMTSMSLDSVFTTLRHFSNKPFHFSIHVMGSVEDLLEAYTFFQTFTWTGPWKITVFVPEKYYTNWHATIAKENLTIGIWYDVNEWESKRLKPDISYLLMTVIAGKSGQKLTPEMRVKALKKVRNNPRSRFILDGGWGIDEKEAATNLEIVSYTSFWKKFLG